MKNKVLIIGGSGLVGSTLVNYMQDDYDIHITFNQNKNLLRNISETQIDLLKDRTTIIDLIKDLRPNFTVHTVALSSVDLCEKNTQLADHLHVEVTKDISKACKEVKSKLLFLSTDAVFDGELNKKYTEFDKPNPINYYGVTKLNAEKIILESSSDNVVLRTAVIYGWHKKSRFTNWILGSLMKNQQVDPFIDQYNTPTLVDDLAIAINNVLKMNISGLYHATGKTCLNRYDFALKIAEIFGFDKNLIKPVTSSEKKQNAPRPTSTCLDSTSLEKLINFDFCDIRKGLNFIFKKFQENKNNSFLN